MKMLNRLAIIAFGVLFLLSINSCKHDPVGITSQPDVCFEKEILPIIQNSCAKSGCHSSSDDEGELALNNHNDIIKEVTAFDPASSKIYKAITNTFEPMPPAPNALLTQEQRTKIMLWIAQGAKNYQCN